MFIDSHAHIDGEEFDADREEVIKRAADAGVTTILNVGTGDPHSGAFERAVSLAAAYENIYAAIGVHPHDAKLFDDAAEARIRSLVAGSSKILAWGEIGLDYHYDNSPRDTQRQVFQRQLQAARACDLPVVIHTRSADANLHILQGAGSCIALEARWNWRLPLSILVSTFPFLEISPSRRLTIYARLRASSHSTAF